MRSLSRLSLFAAAGVLLASPSTAASQEPEPPAPSGHAASTVGSPESGFGVRSGTVIGGLAGTDGIDARPGFTLGPTYTFPLTSWLAVQGELLYSRYGARWDAGAVDPAVAPGFGKASFQQMQTPLLLRVDVGELLGSPVMLRFYAGPQGSYMLSCKIDGAVPCGTLNPTSPFSQLTGFDVGGTVGGEIATELFHVLRLGADVRYQDGLNNIVVFDRRYQTQAWTFTIRLTGAGYGAGPGESFIDVEGLQLPHEADRPYPAWRGPPKLRG